MLSRTPILLLAAALLTLLAAGPVADAAKKGKKRKVVTRTYIGPAGSIPDGGVKVLTRRVRARGKVRRVRVSIRANHTFAGDLHFLLRSPRGRFIDLSSSNGGGGDNYGTGPNSCSGTPTVFSDAASTSIRSASAGPPYAGSFKPERPLSGLRGARTRGRWQLIASDGAEFDPGTLGCWKLQIKFRKARKKR